MRTLALIFLSTAAYAQMLDLSSLDKLIPKASEHSVINLDGEKLKSSFGMLATDNPSMQALAGMTGIQVVEMKFDKENSYTIADLEQITRQLNGKGWNKIIDVKEKGEYTQMFMRPKEGTSAGGMVIIASQPKELTVVHISGSTDLNSMGILKDKLPKMDSNFGRPGTPKPATTPKDEE